MQSFLKKICHCPKKRDSNPLSLQREINIICLIFSSGATALEIATIMTKNEFIKEVLAIAEVLEDIVPISKHYII